MLIKYNLKHEGWVFSISFYPWVYDLGVALLLWVGSVKEKKKKLFVEVLSSIMFCECSIASRNGCPSILLEMPIYAPIIRVPIVSIVPIVLS